MKPEHRSLVCVALNMKRLRRQEFYTVPLPDGISAFDLDVIKLTAQFVARNGKGFLTGLTSREHMNAQVRRGSHQLLCRFLQGFSRARVATVQLPEAHA